MMMVSAPIESEWVMSLSWKDCLAIQISAAVTACSSANVIGVWFGIQPLIDLFVSLTKHPQAVVRFAWELAMV